MIRINLLGTTKPKTRRAAMAAPTMEIGSVGSPTVKVLVAIALSMGINGYWWYSYDKQAQDIAAKTKIEEQKNRELSDVKAKYLERQKQHDSYQHRVDVID